MSGDELADDQLWPPETRIELLTALRADPPPGADPAELAGELGAAYLARYDARRDAAALAAGIAELEDALAQAPGHPAAPEWRCDLGLGYAFRAEERQDPGDYERAIAELGVVRAGLRVGDPGHDVTVLTLAEAHWHRLRLLRSLHCGEPVELLAEAERVAATVGTLTATIHDTELAGYGRLLQGQARLAVYAAGERPVDRDEAIALLDDAVQRAGPDTPDFLEASLALCLAYQQRAGAAGGADGAAAPLADLTAAIRVGRRAADACPPDDPGGELLHETLASIHHDRWDITDDPEDLDQAIESWRRVQAYDSAAVALGLCGYLLRERGVRSGSRADLDEAVRLLERSLTQPADEEFDVIRRYELAQAYQARWQLGSDPADPERAVGGPDDLDRAVGCLDYLIAMPLPTGDLVSLHGDRLSIGPDLLNAEAARAPQERPRSGPRLLRWLAEARALWERAGDIDPSLRCVFAAQLAITEFYTGWIDPDTVDLDRVVGLLGVARTMVDPPPGYASLLDALDALVGQVAAIEQRDAGGQRSLVGLVRAARAPDADPTVLDLAQRVIPVMSQIWAGASGDRRAIRGAKRRFDADGQQGWGGVSDDEAALLGGLLSIQERAGRGDTTGAGAEARRLTELVGPIRAEALGMTAVRQVLTVIAQMFGGGAGPPDAAWTRFAPSAGLGGRMVLATEVLAEGGRIAAAVTRNDVPALRACAARIAELAAHAPPGARLRLVTAAFGGQAELAIARADPADVAAARRAVIWWTTAAECAGGPAHPVWATIAMGQAEAMRRAVDPNLAWSRRLGLSALRAHLWQVLLQSGTDDALSSAADAAADALTVAAWCRTDHCYEDLVAALDAGRGLVLHAATTSRRVADLLVAAGRADLAERWRESAGHGRDLLTGVPLVAEGTAEEVPDDLRSQVLRVLGVDDPWQDGPFTPVNTGEIRAALATLGADALGYLVPETGARPGMAVVVPAHGPVTSIDLPELRVGAGTPVARYVATGGRYRDLGPVAAAQGSLDPAASALHDMCRWAWSAAIGPLLHHTRWRAPGRPLRLVLVPVGMLALVPWHAAVRFDGSGRRFAVEEAVFSYTISARTLCASARLPARPIRSVLVVGDPTGDLPFAGAEARAIRDMLHPGATYLGSPAGTGTAGQVLDWIAGAGPGGSLLHLACHGRVDPTAPLDGHLALADGPLTARQLLDASRLAGLVIDQVFLAACTTSLASGTYDEAFSLATAFLAAGAGTVFGSLWAVPDTETSLLMYLVHHHLTVDGCTPADALHRAQLWMLDPARQPPPGMPAELARHSASQRAADPVAWAAFTHLGR